MYCIDIFGCNYNNICHTTFQSIMQLINENAFLSVCFVLFVKFYWLHSLILRYSRDDCITIYLKYDIFLGKKTKNKKPSLLIAMLSLIFLSNYLLVMSSSTDSRQFTLASIDFLSELAFSFDDYMSGPQHTAQSSSWSILSWRHHNH